MPILQQYLLLCRDLIILQIISVFPPKVQYFEKYGNA